MNDPNVRALSLFDDYVDLTAKQRLKAMRALEIEDPATHRVLSSMLDADAVDAPLGEPPLELLQQAEVDDEARGAWRVGTRIGAWWIESVIGIGGMGTVYGAQRDDGHYQQYAALKCISNPSYSPQLVEALLNERNTLAQLDHPNIAPLLDGGVDEHGQPWFAMRFVNGSPIDQWSDRRQLGVRQRVALLIQVCDAIAYAHQLMVLHQDIKPSNVLVTEDGRVQLLDFGLATTLDIERQLPRVAFSHGYTAPEALMGFPPSAVLDVYSLGMLAYQLLCGSRPPSGLAQAVGTPPSGPASLPSELAQRLSDESARQHGVANGTALARQLSGDLDAIALRSTAAEPAKRYASASELRDDLQRWLERRPVQSRNGGPLYKGRKFFRRHALAAVLASLVLTTTAVALGIHYLHGQRAAREAASFMALAQVFEQTLGSATLSGLGDHPFSSNALLSQAEAQVRQLALQDQPAVMARGMLILSRNYAVVGDYRHAQSLVREAAKLHGDEKISVEVIATQAALLNIEDKPAQALELSKAALESLERDEETTPLRLQLLTEIARAQWNLAEVENARKTLTEALDLVAARGSSQDPTATIELLTLRGSWQLRMQRLEDSDADTRQAIALATPKNPLLAARAQRILIFSYITQERNAEALLMAREQLTWTRDVLGKSHPQTGIAGQTLAYALIINGDLQSAREVLDESEAIVAATYGHDHPEYAESLRIRSFLMLMEGGPYEEMLAVTRQSEAILRRHFPADNDRLIRIRTQLGNQLSAAPASVGDARDRALLDESIRMLRSLVTSAGRTKVPPPVGVRIYLANALTGRNAQGDLEEAAHLLADNSRQLETNFPSTHSVRSVNDYVFASVQHKLHRYAEADALLEAVIARMQRQLPDPNARMLIHSSLLLRASAASGEGKRQRALEFLTEAHALVTQVYEPEHALVKLSADALATLARTGKYDVGD